MWIFHQLLIAKLIHPKYYQTITRYHANIDTKLLHKFSMNVEHH